MKRTLFNLMHTFVFQTKSSSKPSFHSHPEYEMLYFHTGTCKYLIGDECFEITPGSLVIMDGMSRHGPIMSEPCMRTVLRFDSMEVLPLMRLPDSIDLLRPFRLLRHYHWRLDGAQKTEIESILARMNHHYSRTDTMHFNRLRAAFLDLLLFVYECSEQQVEHAGLEQNSVHNALVYIEQHYMDDFSLDELAASVNFSRCYMSRLFKERTGMTVFDYVNKRRINEAKLLFLIDRACSVTEVCFRVGYKHLTHFSRTFKRMVGMTPEQFRKLV